VNCAPIVVSSQDDRKAPAEKAIDEMVLGAVWAVCEFSLLVRQQNHSDQSITTLDDALKRLNQKKGIIWEQTMSKSAEAKVDNLLATEFHQLCERNIDKTRAAMEALVYEAEKVSMTKCRDFHGYLNRARDTTTTRSDADCQEAIERLEREIHQVTPDKLNLFDKLFQHHEQQLLQEVGTNATSTGSVFTKQLPLINPDDKDEACGVATSTADKRLQFQIRLSDAGTAATTWRLADMQRVSNQVETEIYGISSNEQKQCKKKLSIRLIEFEAWWKAHGIQALRKTIEQCVIHSRYPKMHQVSHISFELANGFRWQLSDW